MKKGELLLGKYRLARPCGSTSSVESWHAIDEVADSAVCIRYASRTGAVGEAVSRRLAREYALMSAVSHPGLPRPLQLAWLADGRSCMILPDNAGLRMWREVQWKELPLEIVLQSSLEMLSLVGFLHRIGIVHGEVDGSTVYWDPSSPSSGWSCRLPGLGRARLLPDSPMGTLLGAAPCSQREALARDGSVDLSSALKLAVASLAHRSEPDRCEGLQTLAARAFVSADLARLAERTLEDLAAPSGSGVGALKRLLRELSESSAPAATSILTRHSEGAVPCTASVQELRSGLESAILTGGAALVLLGEEGYGRSASGVLLRALCGLHGARYIECTERNWLPRGRSLTSQYRAFAGDVRRRGEPQSEEQPTCPPGCAQAIDAGAGLEVPAVCFADDADLLPRQDIELILDVHREALRLRAPVLLVLACSHLPDDVVSAIGRSWDGSVLQHGGQGNHAHRLRLMQLPRMNRKEISLLLDQALGAPIDSDAARWIESRSAGSPLLAELLGKTLLCRGAFSCGASGLRLDASLMSEWPSPASEQDLVSLCLDHLGEQEISVAEVLSISGALSLGEISAAADLEQDTTVRCLETLKAAGVVEGSVDTRHWWLSHEVWRSPLCSSASPENLHGYRRRLACRLAEGVSPSDDEALRQMAAAWHFYLCGDTARALECAMDSAEMLAERGCSEEAGQMIELAEEGLSALGSADDMRLCRLRILADTCWSIGDVSDASRLYSSLAVESRNRGLPDADLVELEWLSGRAAALSGRRSRATEELAEAGKTADSLRSHLWSGRVKSALAIVYQMQGDFDEVMELADQSIDLLSGEARPDLLASGYNSKGNALLARCRWDEAIEAYKAALGLARESGVRHLEVLAEANIGLTELYACRWQDAASHLDHATGLAKAIGSAYCLHVCLGAAGLLSLRQGSLDDASVLFAKAHSFADRSGDPWGVSVALMNEAEFQQEVSEPRNALCLLSRAESVMMMNECHDDLAELHRRRAECLLEIGHREAATSECQLALECSIRTGNALEVANTKVLLACTNSRGANHEDLAEACSIPIGELKALGADYDAARACTLLGRTQAACSNQTGAIGMLRQAQSMFSELGARRHARCAAEQLAVISAGSVPAPRSLSRDADFLSGLFSAGRMLAASEASDGIAGELVDIVVSRLSVDYAAVGILRQDGDIATATSLQGQSDPESERAYISCLIPHMTAGGRCEPMCLAADEAHAAVAPLLRDRGVAELLFCPMVSGERLVGCLCLEYRRHGRRFSKTECSFAYALAAQCAMAVENAELRARLREEVDYLRWEVDGRFSFANIIGRSLAMQRVFSVLQRVALSSATVLVEGESGTGKELAARAIHYNGPRRRQRFVAQNCAALPESLLESELFGHVRGAFTGAAREKAGLFEAADGGTFFLDEIGDMPLPLQAKLLRVLQDGEMRRVGATEPRTVDVRVVAATNRSLEDEVKHGRFREDLYYRLNVVRIRMPPLRDRREDIPLLADHFLCRFQTAAERDVTGFTDEAMGVLMGYDWPGNVRELRNEIERAVALSRPGAAIASHAFSERVASAEPVCVAAHAKLPSSLKELVDDIEARVILETLRRNKWNKSRTAELLGLSRQGLLKKISRLRIARDDQGDMDEAR